MALRFCEILNEPSKDSVGGLYLDIAKPRLARAPLCIGLATQTRATAKESHTRLTVMALQEVRFL